jgi:cytidylate kinase
VTLIVVAIDGPAGAGKSTVSRRLAQVLGYAYVDTGAMYRAVAVLAAEQGLTEADEEALVDLCRRTEIEFVECDGQVTTRADGRDLSTLIRTAEAGQLASRFSTVAPLRQCLVDKQRAMGAAGGVVMEGRDIGTVVFPDAAVKIFLEASAEERARRRAMELDGAAGAEDVRRMAREIAERDARDRGRAHSPLSVAADAVVVDTTKSSIEDVVRRLHELITARVAALASQC